MFVLVGLGNPGDRYQGTRHNAGWHLTEAVVAHYRLQARGRRFRGQFGEGVVEGEKLLWLLPETFMNLSGQAVAELVRFYKCEPSQVIVIHDDLDLAPGRVKIKQGGGHAGHNGLRSIQGSLGSADFIRVRVGIGRPNATTHPDMTPAQFVLAPFMPGERALMDQLARDFPPLFPLLLRGEAVALMNGLARKPAAGENLS
jgi:PTH1 family peptidyl-tRNA hydrolase